MSYKVLVRDEIGANIPQLAVRITRAAQWVLRDQQATAAASVSVVIMSDEAVQALNRTYRQVDAPTDVLSFAAEPDAFPPSSAAAQPDDEEKHYLGDLILALPYIQRQAARSGHMAEDEIVLAVVHGTLHLLGHDHDTPLGQTAMWNAQARALDALGVAITVSHYALPADNPDNEGEA